jgi:type IV fimbrial biogenesis protein FimT
MQEASVRVHGFSLVELLIGVTLFAIVLALATPAYARLAGRTHAATSRNALHASLNHARIVAAARNAQVVVCPSENANRCDRSTHWQQGWIAFVDLDRDAARSPDEPLLHVAQAQPADIAILGTQGRLQVAFRPDGSVTGSNATLTICSRSTGAAAATALVINQAGRTRVGKPSAEAAESCQHAAGG